MRFLLAGFLAISTFSMAHAQKQKFDPPKTKTPNAETLKLIEEKTAHLRQALAGVMQKKDLPDYMNADLDIYLKAAEWIVRHREWFTADSGKQTLAVLDQGLKRIEAVKDGKTPWLQPGKAVARGYRSMIDGSVQPYGVIYPADYGKDKNKKWRLDIVLHGRDSSLTEVKFLNQHDGRPAPKDLDRVILNIYGRGNNAYRWAGERDVSEAFVYFTTAELVQRNYLSIDFQKLVLRGFSMGGAGTWHIGLRHPGNFAALQPGAGFATTHGYIARLPNPLPPYQEACLKIYDAYRYAENAFNVPVIAYSGALDKQKQAADMIEAELKKLQLSDRMEHVIAPGLEHRFPPEWQAKVEEIVRQKVGEHGRPHHPDHVRFVTYTLKQDRCNWVEIHGLGRHYELARVDAKWDDTTIRATTENITRIRFSQPPGKLRAKTVTLDGKDLPAAVSGPWAGTYQKNADGWAFVKDDTAAPLTGKRPRLQGPIDDAFTSPFLCVIGTGKPNNKAMHDAAVAQLDRFRREWDKYMRGTLVVKKDTEVTDDDRKQKNLILFGDPGSNKLIAEALGKLPIKWTTDALEFASAKYDASTHLPMLIQPSPFDQNRYVVLNSGHTFHEADFKGTNALLYPRLGDFAVVKPTPTEKEPAAFEVITAGLFDESWQFPKK